MVKDIIIKLKITNLLNLLRRDNHSFKKFTCDVSCKSLKNIIRTSSWSKDKANPEIKRKINRSKEDEQNN